MVEQPDAAADQQSRRNYLDWLRGAAVVIMIEGHLLDSWTRLADRDTPGYQVALIVSGFGAPLFLFLAGVAVPLSASAKTRRTGDAISASRAVVRRGFQIFGLAFLFRVQAWILGWSSPRNLLKVDILNIMGPSVAAAAALWGAARTMRARLLAFLLGTVVIAFATPLIRAAPLDALPDPIEAYIRPVADLSNFVFFPSAAFVFAGAMAGHLIDATARHKEARLNGWFFCAGVALAALALAASYFPSPYATSSFWTSAPSYFFIRCGVLIAAIGIAYAWESRRGGQTKWSPLRQLGRASLFIYWIHVEMVYGLVSEPLHHALTLPQALLAFALFTIFMLLCSIAKDRVVRWWTERAQEAQQWRPIGFISRLPRR